MIAAHHGWAGIVRRLNKQLGEIAPNLRLNKAVENEYGLPLFSLSTTGLTEQQATLALNAVNRAEKVAQETCIRCGGYGRLSYTREGGHSGVFCDDHRPGGWEVL